MQIGYFNTAEFESRDGKPSPYGETVVHRELIVRLNAIRAAFGRPIIVTSGYRSPEHNKHVGGVKNSTHVLGIAADIQPKDLNDLDELYNLVEKFNKNGGIGRYNDFIHVDVRGVAARWDKRK